MGKENGNGCTSNIKRYIHPRAFQSIHITANKIYYRYGLLTGTLRYYWSYENIRPKHEVTQMQFRKQAAKFRHGNPHYYQCVISVPWQSENLQSPFLFLTHISQLEVLPCPLLPFHFGRYSLPLPLHLRRTIFTRCHHRDNSIIVFKWR